MRVEVAWATDCQFLHTVYVYFVYGLRGILVFSNSDCKRGGLQFLDLRVPWAQLNIYRIL